MIAIVLDTIIPGDIDLKMPPASSLDFENYITSHGIRTEVLDYLNEVSRISLDKYTRDFTQLDEDERTSVLNETKIRNLRLFTQFLAHCLRAYYSNAVVLNSLRVGSVPPFPRGNIIESDNWDLLEPVYERGSVYRCPVIRPKTYSK